MPSYRNCIICASERELVVRDCKHYDSCSNNNTQLEQMVFCGEIVEANDNSKKKINSFTDAVTHQIDLNEENVPEGRKTTNANFCNENNTCQKKKNTSTFS